MNRLAEETSPYLRQHADNPVDWYPFGTEPFEVARRLDRPVFVSIGYSACHWCHVMAHESFEDQATAAYLNERFVSVKVDREERPDVDAVYMEAVQALTGQGGWPLTVFCDGDGRPFYGGTYFAFDDLYGRPSFRRLLQAIDRSWRTNRHQLLEQASELTQAIDERLLPPPGEASRVTPERVAAAVRSSVTRLVAIHDPELGGFNRAPKFPQPPLLELLLRAATDERAGSAEPMAGSAEPRAAGAEPRAAGAEPIAVAETPLSVVTLALDAMARGGIYDHLGGGFARYSVDRAWRVPHFEKMLYDQAGLARVYLHGWQLTGDPGWRQVLDETVGYVLAEMTIPEGGVHSAEDADSEGEEGLYYLWTPEQLEEVLGSDRAELAGAWYGVSAEGDLDRRSVLHRPPGSSLLRPPEIEEIRLDLLAARRLRVRPGRDDKVLTEWNAMWCSALAEAAAVTGEQAWATAAVDVAEFLLGALRRDDGRLLRSWQGGRATHLAYSADYAWLAEALVRVAELTGQRRWLDEASMIADELLRLSFEPGDGFFTTGSDAEPLIVRPRELHDGVIPGAASVAALALCRLGALTGDGERLEQAAAILAGTGPLLDRAPTTIPQMLHAAALLADGAVEVVVTGDRSDLVAEARRRFIPAAVLAWGEIEGPPTGGRQPGLAYLCHGGVCSAPVSDRAALSGALGRLVGGAGAG